MTTNARGGRARGTVKSFWVFLVAVACVAVLGAMFRPGQWYYDLTRPAWTAPDWLFGPVWGVLYVAIAVAGWLIWRSRPEFSLALRLWVLQLILNAAWPWLFFGLHRPGWAFVDIATLFVAIAAFCLAARRTSRTAALIFGAYALWVAYAAALNFHIWQNNRPI